MHGPKWSCRAFPPPGEGWDKLQKQSWGGEQPKSLRGGAANGTKQRVLRGWAPDGTRCPRDSSVAISGVAVDELAAAVS